jgi:transposase
MAKSTSTSIFESLASIILPEGILDLFEVTNVEEEHTGIKDETGTEVRVIHIYLDERDLREEEWHDLQPNGFTEPRKINDFPIRDRKVVLHVRRRRWLDGEGKSIILKHDDLVAQGTSYSREFAGVLKKIFGYLPDTGPLSGAVL